MSANSLFPPTQLIEMVNERLSDYPVDVLQAAGHQLDKLILSCTYDTDECLWVWGWLTLKVIHSPLYLEPWLTANQISAPKRELWTIKLQLHYHDFNWQFKNSKDIFSKIETTNVDALLKCINHCRHRAIFHFQLLVTGVITKSKDFSVERYSMWGEEKGFVWIIE